MYWNREYPGAGSVLRSMEGICAEAVNSQELGVH